MENEKVREARVCLCENIFPRERRGGGGSEKKRKRRTRPPPIFVLAKPIFAVGTSFIGEMRRAGKR